MAVLLEVRPDAPEREQIRSLKEQLEIYLNEIDRLIAQADANPAAQAGVLWGDISGTLSNQADLQSVLNAKAGIDDIPTKTSELDNDSGFLTQHQSLDAYRTSVDQDIIDAGKADVGDIPTLTSQLTNDSGFLTAHQSLAAYRTSADQDVIDAGKQDVISDLASIRSGASAGATAYQKPASGIPKADLASEVQTSLDNADIAGLMDDYIVERGTSGIWTYQKYASGDAKLYGKMTQNITGWSAWGPMYYGTPYTTTANYPFTFKENPLVIPAATGPGGSNADSFSAGMSNNGTTGHTPYFFVTRPATGATGTWTIHINVFGKWK